MKEAYNFGRQGIYNTICIAAKFCHQTSSTGPEPLFLKEAALISPEQKAREDEIGRFFQNFAKTYPHWSLLRGLKSVSTYHFFGPLEDLFIYANHLASSLKDFIKYQSIVDEQAELFLQIGRKKTSFMVNHPLSMLVDQGLGIEIGMGLIFQVIKRTFGKKFSLERVKFAHPAHDQKEVYEKFFDCPVEFNQKSCAIVIPSEMLEMESPSANPMVYESLLNGLKKSMVAKSPREAQGLVHQVKTLAPLHHYNLEQIAGSLELSKRSLQRKAEKLGLSLKDEIQKGRQAKAIDLLKNSSYSIEAIALQLGYSHSDPFRRAFKKWTGQNPNKFR